MKKERKWLISLGMGLLWMGLTVLLSRVLIRQLGGLVGAVSGWLSLDAEVANRVARILSQLKRAALGVPWIVVGCFWAVIGCLYRALYKKKAVWFILMILLLLPMMAAVLWFTEINGIQLGAFLKTLLPLLPGLL